MSNIKRDSTDKSWYIVLLDSSDALVTGKTYSDVDSMGYRRYNGLQEVTEITSTTPATLASKATAHSDGGFLEDIDNSGVYRYDAVDAAFATGADSADNVEPIISISGISSIAFERVYLTDFDPSANIWSDSSRTLTSSDNIISDSGVINSDNGIVEGNIKQINDNTNAAINLGLSTGQIIPGTVDTTAVGATNTSFESDDITEATNDHYNGRTLLFTSGDLIGQATSISDYTTNGGNGVFTVVALTEAPADNVTFIII